MTISAAAIANSMGEFDNKVVRPLQSFLSLGLGDWIAFPPRFERRFLEISIHLVVFFLLLIGTLVAGPPQKPR